MRDRSPYPTWPTVSLGDVTELKYGKGLPSAERSGGGFPVYGSNGAVGLHEAALTVGPTIVIGRKGSLGRVHYSPGPCWPIDTTYFVDETCTRADLRWLGYRLEGLGLTEMNSAAAVPGLNRDDAYRQKLLLPPIQEQRRIAAVLDAADALRARRCEALAKLDQLTWSVFIDLFGGGGVPPVAPRPINATHPKGWNWSRLLNHAELATGHTPDREVPEYWGGEVSWLNLNEIRSLDGKEVRATSARITQEGLANSSAVLLPVGTVCFSRTASIGFVTTTAAPMATSQDFVNWICGDALNPLYLMHALIASRDVLRASSSGSTHRTIYLRDAERFTALVPPREIQDRFAEVARFVAARRESMLRAAARLDILFAVLKQRAFRGEL